MNIGKITFGYLSIIVLAIASAALPAIPYGNAQAGELFVAASDDISDTAKSLAEAFESETGSKVQLTNGTSAGLAHRVESGERFDVFMSSGTEYPGRLADKGLVSGQPAAYALGILALYAKGKDMSKEGLELLRDEDYAAFVIPDPVETSYGKAALEFLKKEKVYDTMKDRITHAPDAVQALARIESGTAQAGLVSYADLSPGQQKTAWIIPQRLYDPIEQQAAVISGAPNSELALKWITFLGSDSAQEIILSAGFGIPGAEITETPTSPPQ